MAEEDRRVNVVFEYLAGSYTGGRFICHYPLKDIERVTKATKKPGSKTKIVAIDIPDQEATRLCDQALIESGVVLTRIQALEDDPDMPPAIRGLEARKMLFALGTAMDSEMKALIKEAQES